MKLFIWRGKINGFPQAVFAIAEDYDKAKKIALEKAPGSAKEDVSKIIKTVNPITYDKEASFIAELGLQLVA